MTEGKTAKRAIRSYKRLVDNWFCILGKQHRKAVCEALSRAPHRVACVVISEVPSK